MQLFVDFDGTIAREDVGNKLFRKFGGKRCDELVRRYREGSLSAVECFREEAAAMGTVNVRDLDDFLRLQEIDEGFLSLTEFCRVNHIGVTILSDGLEYYIRMVMGERLPDWVRVFANEATFHPVYGNQSVLQLRFPHQDAECLCCACCKRNIMLSSCSDEDVIVYVGEGLSDICPAQYADIVFAKLSLQTFCQRENISYYPYSTLYDVVERLAMLHSGRTPVRKRRQAALKRREAFMIE
jgi:2,3-diketo-5-methylthio-1-phosphopentane phosphatase